MSLKPNVGIYCRLSREDEDSSQSSSIQNQKEFLTDYANKNNWNIYDYYIDDGYTGTNFNRPGFKRMINDIENKLINIVITKDLSRLGRNYLDTGRYTEEYFPLHNIRYIAVNDNFDSNNSDNEFAPFKNIINEWYAKDISKKVKSTFKIKKEKGMLFKNSIPLYGYKYDDTGNRIIDEQVADNIRLIFNMYINGNTVPQIAEELTKRKVYTPKNYLLKLSERNNDSTSSQPEPEQYSWTTNHIRRILNNRLEYTGAYVLNKTYQLSFKIKKRIKNNKENTLIFKGKAQPIISQEIYERVDSMIKERTFSRLPIEVNQYRDLLICGCCGRTLKYRVISTSETNARIRYMCRNSKCTDRVGLKYSDVDTILKIEITKLIKTLLSKEQDFIEYVTEIAQNNNQKFQETQKLKYKQEIEKLNKRIQELETLIQKLFENKVTADIPDAIFHKMMKQYRTELEEKENQLSEINKQFNAYTEENNPLQDTLNFINKLKQIDETNIRREDILSIIKNVTVHKVDRYKRILEINYYKVKYLIEGFTHEQQII